VHRGRVVTLGGDDAPDYFDNVNST
jgi:hypothetical protein